MVSREMGATAPPFALVLRRSVATSARVTTLRTQALSSIADYISGDEVDVDTPSSIRSAILGVTC